MARAEGNGNCRLEDEGAELVKNAKDTIVAKEGVASGKIEQDRLRRERQAGK
jgi:hypothetical protein